MPSRLVTVTASLQSADLDTLKTYRPQHNHRIRRVAQRCRLPAIAQAVAEEVVKLGNIVNFLDCCLDIVFDAPVINGVGFQQDITATPIAVARLSNRADV